MNIKVIELRANYNNFVYARETEVVLASIVDAAIDPIKKIKASDSVSDSDAVFFHSSSKIPRYKFTNFSEGKKLRRVISIDKATAIVINKDIVDSSVSNHAIGYKNSYYILPTGFAEKYPKINPNTNKGYYNSKDIDLTSYPTIIREGDYEKLMKAHGLPDPSSFQKEVYYDSNFTRTEGYKRFTNGSDDLDKAIKSGIKFVEDSTLNTQMTIGSLTISAENYDEFCRMICSPDRGVVDTAMELIANSDYVASQFYIGLLLNSYQSVFRQYTSKSVNLKNFFEYFSGVKWQNPRHQFLVSLRESLIANKALDDYKESFIRLELLNYANSILNLVDIKVKEVYFKDETIPEVVV